MRWRSAGHAERRDIADAVGIEGGVGGGQRRLRRGRAGLADLEMDDGIAGRLLLGGGGHHIHDDERIDRAAAARELARHRPRLGRDGEQREPRTGRIDRTSAGRGAAAQPRRADDGVDGAALPASGVQHGTEVLFFLHRCTRDRAGRLGRRRGTAACAGKGELAIVGAGDDQRTDRSRVGSCRTEQHAGARHDSPRTEELAHR